jgi:hypothetical protein
MQEWYVEHFRQQCSFLVMHTKLRRQIFPKSQKRRSGILLAALGPNLHLEEQKIALLKLL